MSDNLGISYSQKYYDNLYEYRLVILPKAIFRKIEQGKIYNEIEWRSLGIQQSQGWIHYDFHRPEPHILMFRRLKDQNTANVLIQKSQFS